MNSKEAYLIKVARVIVPGAKGLKVFANRAEAAASKTKANAAAQEAFHKNQRSKEVSDLLADLRGKKAKPAVGVSNKGVAPAPAAKPAPVVKPTPAPVGHSTYPKPTAKKPAPAGANVYTGGTPKPIATSTSNTPISDAPSVQKKFGIGEHFKKHWPGYIAAGGVGTIGGAALFGGKKKQEPVQV